MTGVNVPKGYDVGELPREHRNDIDEARRIVLELADAAPQPGPAARGFARLLAESRVDLVQRIRDGIPERAWVPGAHGLDRLGAGP